MALRFLLLAYLCAYAQVSAFPSNIETNQIVTADDLDSDSTSTEIKSLELKSLELEQVNESEAVTEYENEAVESNSSTTDSSVDSENREKSDTEEVKSATETKTLPVEKKTEFEFRVMYLPIRSPMAPRPSCGCSSAFPMSQLGSAGPYRTSYSHVSSQVNPLQYRSLSLPGMSMPSTISMSEEIPVMPQMMSQMMPQMMSQMMPQMISQMMSPLSMSPLGMSPLSMSTMSITIPKQSPVEAQNIAEVSNVDASSTTTSPEN